MTQIEITTGTLEGQHRNGIHSFKGIPFGAPFTKRSRWQLPQSAQPWTGIKKADSYGTIAPQFVGDTPPFLPKHTRTYIDAIREKYGTEGLDCLNLNVWTPSVEPSAKKGVLVFVHGGSFTMGSATEMYDGQSLAAQGIVVVTIQYRLGPLGFLHGEGLFDDDLMADNRGLHDILLALKWVQQNISQFGGDPDNVTLSGQSAGAFAAFQISGSPLAKGLFNRVISMGAMPDTWAPAEDYHALTADALRASGIRPGDKDALINLDEAQTFALQGAVRKLAFRGKPGRPYGALRRKKLAYMGAASNTPFLPQPPLQAYKENRQPFDLMVGTTAHDGRLFSLFTPLGKRLTSRLLSTQLAGIMPKGGTKAAAAHYRRHAPKQELARLYELINHDAFYRAPSLRAARVHAAANIGNTYHFQLDYPCAIPGLGSIHGTDVALLFASDLPNTLTNNDETTLQVINQWQQAVASFVQNGQPKADAMPQWQQFDPNTNEATMLIDHNSTLQGVPHKALMNYWDVAE